MYAHLDTRLQQLDHVRPEDLQLLQEKLRHYRVRADLPPNHLQRLPIILRELPCYLRYSKNGLASAIRDIIAI